MGAIHSTKIFGNFGPKLNGLVRSNRKSFEKTSLPFEVDHFSRSDRSEFWLNGSRPIKWKTQVSVFGANFRSLFYHDSTIKTFCSGEQSTSHVHAHTFIELKNKTIIVKNGEILTRFWETFCGVLKGV